MMDKGFSTGKVEIDVDSLMEAVERNSGGSGAVVKPAAGGAFARIRNNIPVARPSWDGKLFHREIKGRKIDDSPFRCGR